jgi:CHAT domain-containing protein
MRLVLFGLLLVGALARPAWAQEEAAEWDADARGADAARATLALPLPAAGPERLVVLERQWAAARALALRSLQLQLVAQLFREGEGHPRWPEWVRGYLSAEFAWGRSGAAMAACEPLLARDELPLGLRASVALRQTYMATESNDRLLAQNHWQRAQRLLAALPPQPAAALQVSRYLAVDRLQVRSALERLDGEHGKTVASLREAVRQAQALLDAAEPAERETALGWLDGSQGMLVYAWVRQGRPAEGLAYAEAELARWVARGEGQGARVARWHYRVATARNALQQHAQALAAADASERLLQQAGVLPHSHTRHLAQAERVRALIGLRRWADADAAYQAYLSAVADDALATNRARDARLLPLLAAQNGRLDEAKEMAERSLRYRQRQYGNDHPNTQEMAGVLGFVLLQRGEERAALAQLEQLFVATLDRPSGWLDLDARGQRGFVLGVVFDAYLAWVARQQAQGVPLPPAAVERALQVADRLKLGSTQRALADASARLLAQTPELRALVDAEQAARASSQSAYASMSALLSEEDALRKSVSAPEFKQLSRTQREAQLDQLKAVRARLDEARTQAQAGRAQLEAARERLLQQAPAYADLVAPALPRAPALSRWLASHEGLLVVHTVGDTSLAWWLRRDQPLRLAVLGAADALAARVQRWRAALDRSADLAGPAPLEALAPEALGLHQLLLGPWGEGPQGLQGVTQLIVASSGELATVPMGALLRQPLQPGRPAHWLLRDMAVVQLPSAASLQALRRGLGRESASAPVPTRALWGVGDPEFRLGAAPTPPGGPNGTAARAAPRLLARPPTRSSTAFDAQLGFRYGDLPPLPDTRVELLALAKALGADPQRDLLLGARATREAVLAADLGPPHVLAFATHGLLPGELPGVSKPALALAAVREGSPLLELDDVLTLRTRAQWVLLSACNTGGAQQGDTAMSGLVRGFFFAGARSVMATYWAVESESAAQLTSAALAAERQGPGLSRAAALRQAQLALADGPNPRWRHPYFWAGYALFGDPQH